MYVIPKVALLALLVHDMRSMHNKKVFSALWMLIKKAFRNRRVLHQRWIQRLVADLKVSEHINGCVLIVVRGRKIRRRSRGIVPI